MAQKGRWRKIEKRETEKVKAERSRSNRKPEEGKLIEGSYKLLKLRPEKLISRAVRYV